MQSFIKVVFILFLSVSFAQNSTGLEERKKIYLHGNSVLTGNNILGHHKKKALMDTEIQNDEVKMKYIDVDSDKNTFSSSRADISGVPENSRVAYAALYWTALYPHEKSVLRRGREEAVFRSRGKRDSVIDQILFQVPGGNYIPVQGEILFDSSITNEFPANSPYICMADVTPVLQNLPDINGTYTAANIRATEGQISGGGSAGWFLYVVYENQNESLKYFSVFDGLVEIARGNTDIVFQDFKNKDEGNVRATLSIAALEGDRKLRTDRVMLYVEKRDDYQPLSSSLREGSNFFNSSITLNNAIFENRDPASHNTLGFDLLKMEIPNHGNQIFDHSITEATIRFTTRADRFYLNFVAFETEISADYLTALNSSENANAFIPKTDSDPGMKEETAGPAGMTSAELTALKTSIIQQPNIVIPGADPGYYLVTNVFAVPENASRWTRFLVEKGYEPESLINPENNWDYIYIEKFDSVDTGFERWQEEIIKPYFYELWLMKVNQ